jgi:hypothetical protein
VPLGEVILEMIDGAVRAADASRRRSWRWPSTTQWADVTKELAPGLTVLSAVEATGTLVIYAESRAWALQARLLAPGLIKRLNEILKVNVLKALQIHGPAIPPTPPLPPPKDPVEPALQAARERLVRATPQAALPTHDRARPSSASGVPRSRSGSDQLT